MDKIDTSTAEEAVKDAARQFMSELLPTAAPTVDEVCGLEESFGRYDDD